MPIEDAPRVGGLRDHADHFRVREVRAFPDISGDPKSFAKLTGIVEAMTASGPHADETYNGLLRQAGDDREFAILVVKTLDAVEEEAYNERWALLQLAIDLRNPVVGEYLADFVRRPIGEERGEDTVHGVSTVTEEVILRTTAIEGLARLLTRGFDSTDTLLETIGSSDYVAMRRAAWFVLVDGERKSALERARVLLQRSEFGWIADLRRIPVQEAEQHDPRRVRPERAGSREVPLPFGE